LVHVEKRLLYPQRVGDLLDQVGVAVGVSLLGEGVGLLDRFG